MCLNRQRMWNFVNYETTVCLCTSKYDCYDRRSGGWSSCRAVRQTDRQTGRLTAHRWKLKGSEVKSLKLCFTFRKFQKCTILLKNASWSPIGQWRMCSIFNCVSVGYLISSLLSQAFKVQDLFIQSKGVTENREILSDLYQDFWTSDTQTSQEVSSHTPLKC